MKRNANIETNKEKGINKITVRGQMNIIKEIEIEIQESMKHQNNKINRKTKIISLHTTLYQFQAF